MDTTAPVLSITAPLDYTVHNGDRITLKGTVRDASTTTVSAPGGASAEVTPGEEFALQIQLEGGLNELEVRCRDTAGNTGLPVVLHVARPPTTHDSERLLRPFKVAGEPNTYLVTHTLQVSKRQRLVLPAGTILKFAPSAGVICKGELWVLGTKDERVLFLPNKARWEGIQVLGPHAKATVAWAVIERAVGGLAGQALGNLPPSQAYAGLGVFSGASLVLLDSRLSGAAGSRGLGGGLRIEGEPENASSAVVLRSAFEACRAKRGGGAYCGPWSSAMFVGCTFRDNHASHRGGGLAVVGADGAICMINCAFLENTAHWGGGVALDRLATIRRSRFSQNRAAADGGGLFARSSNNSILELVGVELTENVAKGSGGAAHLATPVSLEACTMTGNRANKGGGLSIHGAQGDPARNLCNRCEFSANEADDGPDVYLGPDTGLGNQAATLPGQQ